MKKLICGMIFAGTAVFSLSIVTWLGCGSPDQIGGGGGSSSGNGGVGPTTIIMSSGGNVGKGGGGGGQGGSGSTPSSGTNCGSTTSQTTREPPDVLLVLDRSSSMAWNIAQDNCYCTQEDITFSNAGSGSICTDTTNCSSRWSAVQPAVISAVTGTKDIQWGLKLFSTPNSASECTVSSEIEVPVAADSASAIQDQVQNATLSLSTPTAAALKAATDYLKTLTDNRPKSILLATDGEPNCAGNPPTKMNDDINGAKAAAAAALAAGFSVYVIGIGPSKALTNLSQLAQSGGTTDYFPASSPEQLVQAFADISQLVASCTFTLSLQPGADLNNVAVYLDKNLVDKNPENGWSFGGGNKTVILNGDACEKVTSGKATTVELYIGCGEPPPPTIP